MQYNKYIKLDWFLSYLNFNDTTEAPPTKVKCHHYADDTMICSAVNHLSELKSCRAELMQEALDKL